jgi:hypothetical protein
MHQRREKQDDLNRNFAQNAVCFSAPKLRDFNKSIELWNLHRVLALDKNVQRVIVVEGFFDCVRVYAAGLCTAG